ncbi:hypothetical protein ACFQ48_11285 [Hymenobacter caeli]|uniref:Lipoprotein n=1 Tax=Hymenobacter caeli TaxID=2735894 RepID=A0ABX2FSB8_9BACT|nr:hypothetical protein [Hymenobacter caeli]NRT19852.1 hypothetical protein [Hymenobacter caeli]
MKPLFRLLAVLGAAALLGACSAAEQTAETAAPRTTPTTINSDADRRAVYDSNGGYNGAVPDATPGRVHLGEQAAGINSKQRVGNLGTNSANTTTPETNVRRIRYEGDTLGSRP